mmetsp:Transcript_4449/g.16235  ORF Transcript_4449/g.16235 Transcript_4449/m.16235 type:complete len:257 (+) Transcript_4449:420-1190(+)
MLPPRPLAEHPILLLLLCLHQVPRVNRGKVAKAILLLGKGEEIDRLRQRSALQRRLSDMHALELNDGTEDDGVTLVGSYPVGLKQTLLKIPVDRIQTILKRLLHPLNSQLEVPRERMAGKKILGDKEVEEHLNIQRLELEGELLGAALVSSDELLEDARHQRSQRRHAERRGLNLLDCNAHVHEESERVREDGGRDRHLLSLGLSALCLHRDLNLLPHPLEISEQRQPRNFAARSLENGVPCSDRVQVPTAHLLQR